MHRTLALGFAAATLGFLNSHELVGQGRTFDFEYSQPRAVAHPTRDGGLLPVDFDGDGKFELIESNGSAPRLWNLDGQLNWGQQSLPFALGAETTIANFDGDPFPDLVWIGTIGTTFRRVLQVGLNSGTGGLTGGPTIRPSAPLQDFDGVDVADFDGDGLDDLLAANDALGYELHLNTGSGSFRLASAGVEGFGVGGLVGDLDGDGDVDVLSRQGADLILYLNDGAGRLTRTQVVSNTSNRIAAVLTDVDSDRDLDLLEFRRASASYSDGTLRVLRNDGTGRFTATSINVGPTVRAGFIDLENDGDLDVLVHDYSGNSTTRFDVLAMRNLGNGTFQRTVERG